MAQPRQPAADVSSEEDVDQDERSTLASIRELLAKSVMLPSDRIRETLDDAVTRGRITRDDAEDLVDRLVALGRQQTEDALARIEAIAGAPARASDKARGAVRKSPGGERVLREVDRMRAVAGLAAPFPIEDYDDLTAAKVIERLEQLDAGDLRLVAEYEKRNANRKSVLAAVEKQLR
ncbi:MAG TPA: hypothetical protein VN238_02370 [Solirubrobacteraceae bacterium]|nr:hypothetical protein [Solirubrobacteraceae bacterium]